MLDLWELMGGLYGNTFLKQYGTVDGSAFKTWGLNLANLSREQIMAGFDRSRKKFKKWPPNAQEFKEQCLDYENYGIPPVAEAYKRALDNVHRFHNGEWQDQWWEHVIEERALSGHRPPRHAADAAHLHRREVRQSLRRSGDEGHGRHRNRPAAVDDPARCPQAHGS